MAWPSPQDYNEALQSPQISFADPDLKGGQVETDKLGLPRPISGGFAVVYKVRSGTRQFAVRCFQREVADQQHRYAAISNHLKVVKLSYTVVFEYLDKGIQIKGKWYPIVKMEWVPGQQLGEYVQEKLNDPTALLNLATSWMTMIETLRQASIAHGDLQDGNVLIVGNDLRLIDYDGMFVPALAGRMSNENGHRNYQHPNRTATDFDLYLDHFSSWVVYVSIVALAIDPSLWKMLRGGDECLIFRKDDFLPNSNSHSLGVLSKHPDPRLRSLASIFESLLYLLPSHVPALSINSAFDNSLLDHNKLGKGTSGGSWLDDHVKLSNDSANMEMPPSLRATLNSAAQPLPTASPTWILDFITPTTTRKTFEQSVRMPRTGLAITLAVMILLALSRNANVELLGESSLAVAGCFLPLLFYRRDPIVQERAAILEREKQQLALMASLEFKIRQNESKKSQLHDDEKKALNIVMSEFGAKSKLESRDKDKVSTELKAKLNTIEAKIADLNRPVQRLLSDYQSNVTRFNQQIAQANQSQASEIATALQPIQRQFVQDFLRNARIDRAQIPGIGPQMIANLRAAGFVTAADVTWSVQNAHGIGGAKASALMGWRQRVETQAKNQMPVSLSKSFIDTVQAKYESQRQQVQNQASSAKLQFEHQEMILNQQTANSKISLDTNRTACQKTYQNDLRDIDARYKGFYGMLKKREIGIKADFVKRQAEVDQVMVQLRKQIYDQNWELAKMRQELDVYSLVTFRSFVMLLLLNRSIK